jgi:phosphoglycolate phosphatase-like HAD superfamily hydrolase
MKDLQDIRAISFDGDMTLWDFEKVMRHSLGLVLAELRTYRPIKGPRQGAVGQRSADEVGASRCGAGGDGAWASSVRD